MARPSSDGQSLVLCIVYTNQGQDQLSCAKECKAYFDLRALHLCIFIEPPNIPTCSHTLPLRILGCRLVSLTFDSLLIHVLSIYLFVGPRHCRTLWLSATRWSAVAGPIWLVGGHRSRLVPVLAGHHTQELWPVLRERLCGHYVVCPAVPGLCPPPDEGAGVEGGRGCCCCCTGGPGGTRGSDYGQGGVVEVRGRGFFFYIYNHGTYT